MVRPGVQTSGMAGVVNFESHRRSTSIARRWSGDKSLSPTRVERAMAVASTPLTKMMAAVTCRPFSQG